MQTPFAKSKLTFSSKQKLMKKVRGASTFQLGTLSTVHLASLGLRAGGSSSSYFNRLPCRNKGVGTIEGLVSNNSSSSTRLKPIRTV